MVNIFLRDPLSLSKSSRKLFKRQKDGYKVTVKISLCICVVLSWDELKVRQNLLASDYEIYMVCLLVATVYEHKSLQFLKKSNIILLFIYDFISCFDDHVMLYDILARFEFRFIYLLHLIILVAWQAWHISSRSKTKLISYRVYIQDNLACKSKYLCPFLSFSILPSLLKRIHIDLTVVVRLYLLGSHALILTER